jgi:transposase
MGQQRRTFSKEFKLEAVRLLSESGKTRAQVARELNIGINTLDRWRAEFATDPSEALIRPFGRGRGKGNRTAEQERIWRLEREVETLKREREILKKTLGIISQP